MISKKKKPLFTRLIFGLVFLSILSVILGYFMIQTQSNKLNQNIISRAESDYLITTPTLPASKTTIITYQPNNSNVFTIKGFMNLPNYWEVLSNTDRIKARVYLFYPRNEKYIVESNDITFGESNREKIIHNDYGSKNRSDRGSFTFTLELEDEYAARIIRSNLDSNSSDKNFYCSITIRDINENSAMVKTRPFKCVPGINDIGDINFINDYNAFESGPLAQIYNLPLEPWRYNFEGYDKTGGITGDIYYYHLKGKISNFQDQKLSRDPNLINVIRMASFERGITVLNRSQESYNHPYREVGAGIIDSSGDFDLWGSMQFERTSLWTRTSASYIQPDSTAQFYLNFYNYDRTNKLVNPLKQGTLLNVVGITGVNLTKGFALTPRISKESAESYPDFATISINNGSYTVDSFTSGDLIASSESPILPSTHYYKPPGNPQIIYPDNPSQLMSTPTPLPDITSSPVSDQQGSADITVNVNKYDPSYVLYVCEGDESGATSCNPANAKTSPLGTYTFLGMTSSTGILYVILKPGDSTALDESITTTGKYCDSISKAGHCRINLNNTTRNVQVFYD